MLDKKYKIGQNIVLNGDAYKIWSISLQGIFLHLEKENAINTRADENPATSKSIAWVANILEEGRLERKCNRRRYKDE